MALGDLFKLAKLTVRGFKKSSRATEEALGKFEVQYNPETLSVKHESVYQPPQGVGANSGKGRWSYAKPSRLSVELVLDGTKVDHMGIEQLGPLPTVSQQIKKFLAICYWVNGDTHEPAYLKLEWGDLEWGAGALEPSFDCRLESVDIKYGSFDRSGAPIHATLTAAFVEDLYPPKKAAKTKLSSPDLTHRRVVIAGDTLPLLCREIYGSSTYYLRVAQVNGLDDFRDLTPGQELIFPPFERPGGDEMGALTVTITSEGKKLDPLAEILSVVVRRELNRVPHAEVTLIDGSVPLRKFELSDTGFFEPGKKVTIAAREGNSEDAKIFEGLVVRHAVESRPGTSSLRVELKDAAFKLTRRRRSAVYRSQADDEAFRKLIGDAGLQAGELASTKPQHPELFQYNSTDWDFIVSRADAQGLGVDAHLGKVSVRPLVSGAAAKVKLQHGLEDVELELELDATDQWAEMSSQAWDVQKLAITAPSQAKDPKVKVGNLDAAAVARKLGGDSYALVHAALVASGELKAWADGRLARSRMTLLRGRANIPGNPDLGPLDVVEVTGVGDRFNGKAVVTGVTHRIEPGGWRTDLSFGLSPEIFARQPDIADVPAGGLLPPVPGLQVGVVAGFEDDPDGEHRIKVLPSVLGDREGPIWARVARPDAGKDRGQVYWPEPGDEVVLGFVGSDPRQAIVLGSLYGPKNTPPTVAGGPTQENDKRAIVSKGGSVILIDDKKNAVSIETPGGNKVTIDDDAKAITLEDQNGNKVTLDSNGISLKSAADFNVDASGKVVIKGTTVDVQ